MWFLTSAKNVIVNADCFCLGGAENWNGLIMSGKMSAQVEKQSKSSRFVPPQLCQAMTQSTINGTEIS